MPTRNSCHIALHGIHSQYFRLELEEVQDMFYRCANGILTPLATPANKALSLAVVHLREVSWVAARIVLIAASENPLVLEGMPLSFHAVN